MPLEIICNDLNYTGILAEKFADIIRETGAFVCLTGEIGAGKTAFSKFLCKSLHVKENVTSPSFVILNEYKSGDIPVYHFDLYRLENEGIKTIINELEEYSEGKILTLVEWSEFSHDSLPFDRVIINIEYPGDNSGAVGETELNNINEQKRKFTFSAYGEKSGKIIKRLENVNISV